MILGLAQVTSPRELLREGGARILVHLNYVSFFDDEVLPLSILGVAAHGLPKASDCLARMWRRLDPVYRDGRRWWSSRYAGWVEQVEARR